MTFILITYIWMLLEKINKQTTATIHLKRRKIKLELYLVQLLDKDDTISYKLLKAVSVTPFKNWNWKRKSATINGEYTRHLWLTDNFTLSDKSSGKLEAKLKYFSEANIRISFKINWKKTLVITHSYRKRQLFSTKLKIKEIQNYLFYWRTISNVK